MPEVAAAEAKKLIDSGAQVVDIRTDVEHEAGHIPGDRHVPLADLPGESAQLNKDAALIVYCRSGNRSGPTAEAFAASGWDAHSIDGGLLAWSEAGYELEPSEGTVIDNPNMPPP